MTLVALGIFAATLTLVIWQPKGFPIGYSALIGAVLALATTVVGLSDVPEVVGIVWNATLAFVAIVLISLLLDEAGFFEWAALHVARWGRGSGRLLFVLIIALGAVVAAVFANDGAALILTPIVIGILRALRIDGRAALGYVMATGFIADTGSLPLVVSNLVNIVSADFFGISFARYATVMVPIGIVSVLASLAVLLLYFGRSIPKTYSVEALPNPSAAVKDPLTFRAGWGVLALLLVGYFAADPLGIPLSVIAGIGTLVLIAVASKNKVVPVWESIKGAPWQIVLFSIGMYLVVFGLKNQGLTDQLARLFSFFGDHGVLVTALGVGIVVAFLASAMNNMPTVLIAALAIAGAGATGLTHEAMVYANVIGSDLGPKITPIGSLATLLWLHVLDKKGIHIGWGRYFTTGIVLTLPVLAVTLAALAGWLMIVG
ncbi:arsenic transporter [Helcobacillus massiliensis]|uniref:Arsenical pump membrane protein n=1 Tax=Helcobacillus massiliensis TaxID=521392 RepID=A0A839QU81_9MICO|nr:MULTISPECIES: arsenic transporter [Helcobacillus]MBB3023632.1 arsenical pump membrane protein [Helcobacillus massiliensis]MCG7427841.1 arsenic transporter [Helcobacillus sp. ACRRO]MCT1558510.1 arsenic transporter [Helcobacillus massiliensis]MCT2036049.1 arsenic transporter [Helcobacillus massiliensis]MCT2332749.1 arsenic transporter [Helcobacillus massiliensis]